MGQKIPLPGTGQEVDPTDPPGAAKTIGLTIAGATLSVGILAIGSAAWNRIASETPDQFSTVNIV